MFDPKDSKTVGYHLFFLPEGELFDNLQNTINQLAEKYGGMKFEPHVTLLARIPKANETELTAKTQKLAKMMKPFEIEPKKVYAQEDYFRALYYKAKYNARLKRYHQKALEMFGVQDVNVYFPHLSLFYGNVPKSIKDEMIASLSLPASMKFLVGKVYLYRTEGEAKDWVRVGAYPLGK
ncbi:MAG: 2'-5' RNA ligase family protein [Patescibacteria group bacterium]